MIFKYNLQDNERRLAGFSSPETINLGDKAAANSVNKLGQT